MTEPTVSWFAKIVPNASAKMLLVREDAVKLVFGPTVVAASNRAKNSVSSAIALAQIVTPYGD